MFFFQRCDNAVISVLQTERTTVDHASANSLPPRPLAMTANLPRSHAGKLDRGRPINTPTARHYARGTSHGRCRSVLFSLRRRRRIQPADSFRRNSERAGCVAELSPEKVTHELRNAHLACSNASGSCGCRGRAKHTQCFDFVRWSQSWTRSRSLHIGRRELVAYGLLKTFDLMRRMAGKGRERNGGFRGK
jgi:hypothetical protein